MANFAHVQWIFLPSRPYSLQWPKFPPLYTKSVGLDPNLMSDFRQKVEMFQLRVKIRSCCIRVYLTYTSINSLALFKWKQHEDANCHFLNDKLSILLSFCDPSYFHRAVLPSFAPSIVLRRINSVKHSWQCNRLPSSNCAEHWRLCVGARGWIQTIVTLICLIIRLMTAQTAKNGRSSVYMPRLYCCNSMVCRTPFCAYCSRYKTPLRDP